MYRQWHQDGAEQLSAHLVIDNPNSSGQGYCPNHTDNPHHAVLIGFDWHYSHTTPVNSGQYSIHTYRRIGTEWCVGVSCTPGYRADAGKLGSGHRTSFFGYQLHNYLKRKTRQLIRGQ